MAPRCYKHLAPSGAKQASSLTETMKVFISWSGKRSAAVADALRYWLPKVIQALEPWTSADDIEKGMRWRSGLATELEQSSVGIICLTRENLDSTWVHFEAGALSKQQQNTCVCTFLFDLEPTDVREPLAQFQATRAQKDDVRKLVFSINGALDDSKLSESELGETFEVWWPKLEELLAKIRELTTPTGPVRTDRELLEEILNLARTHKAWREARADEGDEMVLQYLDWMRGLLSADPNLTKLSALDAVLFQLRHRAANNMQKARLLEQLEALQKEAESATIEEAKDADSP